MGLLRIILLVVSVPVVAGRGHAQAPASDLLRVQELQNTLAAVADRVRPSVVAVRALRRFPVPYGAPPTGSMPSESTNPLAGPLIPSVGSGVVIDRQGLILTNEHVIHGVEPDAIEVVLSTGDRYTVTGMTTDPRSDLAVLSIDATDLKPAVLGDTASLRQGHFVIVMGNPLGTASDSDGRPAMSFGVVSALGQDLTQKLDPDRYYGNLIQTDARINPGNSGGALVALNGEVVGITTAVSSRSGGSDGVGYAIPISNVTRWAIDHLARGEEVRYGYVGIHLEQRRKDTGTEVAISSVEADTPAHVAGLRSGDVILEFGGTPVHNADELIRTVAMAGAGTPVPVVILRASERVRLTVTPAVRSNGEHGVNIEPAFDWRGATFAVVTPALRTRLGLHANASGVVVSGVVSGSPADKAGLRMGDMPASLNDDPVRGFRQFRTALRNLQGPASFTLLGSPPRQVRVP